MNNVSTGNAGEYFVAGELERRGFTCAVPMSNTKDFDILIINRENNKQYAIQVKTTIHKKKSWMLSKKSEELYADNIFYIFVSLNELETPEFHVVPSKVVAEKIKEAHQHWLSVPGRDGTIHKDSSMRIFSDDDNIFLNRWDLLI